MIYLDNNATTAVDPRVFEAMKPFFLSDYGNASSIHALGRSARTALEEARAHVARLVGVRSGEIIFTSGGTESDNLALRGAAWQRRGQGRHIITSRTEHPAVLEACRQLQEEGFSVTFLPVDSSGLVDIEALDQDLQEYGDDTILVSIMYANNETGTLQPIEDIARKAHEHGAWVHSDAVQAMGKIAVKAPQLGVDLLSLTGHKFHGPKGCGALYVRSGLKLKPQMVGGSHEKGFRPGTENVSGAVGLGEACRLAELELDERQSRMSDLRDQLEEGVLASIADVAVNGSREERLPQTANLSFLGVEGESLLMALDLEGVAVSTGAACAAGSHSGSHVLREMRLDKSVLQGAIRFSLGSETTREEIDQVLEL
ncbi:MAG TPA: cysteine desulfurase family protein, partial [Acidobacteriota bacterium]|nr:cysteine desulfurase family protein [Acidobacteriota bacterium]